MKNIDSVQTKYNYIFGIILCLVMLSVFSAINVTLAWLTFRKDLDNTDTPSNIGVVDFKVYKNNQEIEIEDGVYTITCDKEDLYNSAFINIRNVGTISAIIRFEMNIYYINAEGIKTNIHSGDVTNIALNENFVDVFAGNASNTIYSGAIYYNKVFEPYNINGVDVTDNIMWVLEDFTFENSYNHKEETIYVDISNVSMIAYTGNIYKKIYQYTNPGEDWSDETTLQNIFSRMSDAEMPVAGKNAFAYGSITTLPEEFIAYR